MESILLILNSAPSSPNTPHAFETALTLRAQGHSVSVFLIQDAVLTGLSPNSPLARILRAGISVYALDEDLALRGFASSGLKDGIRIGNYAQLVDLFDQPTRVIGAL